MKEQNEQQNERKTELTRAEELYAIAATLMLGRTGLGTNDALGEKYLTEAADLGFVPAILRLAALYDCAGKENDAKAEELYRRAVDAGDRAALALLFLKLHGEGRLADCHALLTANGVGDGATRYAGFFAEHAFFVEHDYARAYAFALAAAKCGINAYVGILTYCLALGAGTRQDLALAEVFLCETCRGDYFHEGLDPLFELAKAVMALPESERPDRLLALALHAVLFSEVTCAKGAKEFRRANFPAGSDKLLDPVVVGILRERSRRSEEEAEAEKRVNEAVAELGKVPDPEK